MAVELMNFRNTSFFSQPEANAAQEAASGLQSFEKLIRLISSQHQNKLPPSDDTKRKPTVDIEEMDYVAVADLAVNKFKKVISLLGRTRTGHARFRRGPVITASTNSSFSSPDSVLPAGMAEAAPPHTYSKIYCPTPIQQVPPPDYHHHHKLLDNLKESGSKTINFSYSPSLSRTNSFISSLTGGGSDQNKQPSSLSVAFPIITNPSNSAVKPPLFSSSSFKRKCASSQNAASGKCSGSTGSRCHCSKRRKLRLKRVIRVPAISMKMVDIPPDDYSWRKYGQKPIKGSPHPRGYYKCSSVRGCPARKHVERALDDPAMLTVTYEGDHNHSIPMSETSSTMILESS